MKENETLAYYDANAGQYAESTRNVSMKYAWDRFLFYAMPKGKILDFGCGSGRDAKFFHEQGFDVDALDGSAQMAEEARNYTGLEVKQMCFQDFHAEERYDGIWANASLLHLPEEELQPVFASLMEALKEEGILYASFKYGDFDGMREGRYYHDLTVESMGKLILSVRHCLLLECWKSHDARQDHPDTEWLNFIVRKTQKYR